MSLLLGGIRGQGRHEASGEPHLWCPITGRWTKRGPNLRSEGEEPAFQGAAPGSKQDTSGEVGKPEDQRIVCSERSPDHGESFMYDEGV